MSSVNELLIAAARKRVPTVFVNTASGVFNGTTQYVYLSDPAGGVNNNDFAVSVWFNRDAATLGTYNTTLCNRANNAVSNGVGFTLRVTNGNVLACDFDLNVNWQNIVSGTTIVSAGVWHHAYMIVTGLNCKMYLDGVLEANSAIALITRSTIGNIDFAAQNYSSGIFSYFQGSIDECALFTGGTYPAVTDLRGSLTGQPKNLAGLAGLYAWWRMENGWSDSSGNGRNLTAVNVPTFSTNVPPHI